MKTIILILLISLFPVSAFAGNEGNFVKGYQEKAKMLVGDWSMGDELLSFTYISGGEEETLLTINQEFDVVFAFTNTNGEKVDVSLAEIYRILDLIENYAGEHIDKPKNVCPFCGGSGRRILNLDDLEKMSARPVEVVKEKLIQDLF